MLLVVACALGTTGCRATGGLPWSASAAKSATRPARPETSVAKKGTKAPPGTSGAARIASSRGADASDSGRSESDTGSVRPAASEENRRVTDERHALGTDADRAGASENPTGWKNLWGRITGSGPKPPRIPLPRTDSPDRPAEDEPSVPAFGATDGP